MENKQLKNLNKLNPTHFLAHHKQSFRSFLTKKIQEAFIYANFLNYNSSYNINFFFLSKYILFEEITSFSFSDNMTYGYHVYIPALISNINENGKKSLNLEWYCCGLLPGMTQNSSFIIEGITRAVFTQLIRKQGLFFHQLPNIQKKHFAVIMELRVKKLNNFSSNFFFYRYNAGDMWIFFKKYSLQIPGPLFLKALNVPTDSIINLFQIDKFKIDHFEYTMNIPSSAFQARYIIYKLYLYEASTHYFQGQIEENIYLAMISMEIDDLFIQYFWTEELRYCDLELRLQLARQSECPIPLDIKKLQVLDFFFIFKRLFDHPENHLDIDNLMNKEIRSCGDFLYLHTLEGLLRFIETIEQEQIRKKLNIQEVKQNRKRFILPLKFLYRFRLTYILSLEWKAFFISGTLSQYGQNLNPLSLLTHSRRLTSLGHGGLNRESASVDVRNIHTTSFGHFCPIETPEGKNVGLIHSLALFTWCHQTSKTRNPENRVIFDEFATPFYYVYKNQVQKEHPLLVTLQGQEENFITSSTIAADISRNKWSYVSCYELGSSLQLPNLSISWAFENELYQETNLQYISPYQIISVVTGLIPFVEHNDANRALMGSNMQRQAVNLLNPSISKVRTGLEVRALSDINYNLYSPKTGFLSKKKNNGFILYTKNLEKCHVLFNPNKKSNEYTYMFGQFTMNQRNWLQKGDFCGDYGSSKKGKLALGQNLFVGYLPWYGWNYEDAIILSEACLPLFTGLQYKCIEFDPIYESKVTLDPKKRKEFIRNDGIFFEVHLHPLKIKLIFSNDRITDLVGDFSDFDFVRDRYNNSVDSKKNYDLFPGKNIQIGDCLYGKCAIFLSFSRSLYSQYLDLEEILNETFPLFEDFKSYAYFFLFYYQGNQIKKLKKRNSLLKNRNSQIQTEVKNTSFIYSEKKNSLNFSSLKEKQYLFKKYYRMKDTSIYANKNQCGRIIHINKQPSFSERECLLNKVKIELVQKKKLEIGDKLSGRHGNKGILSKICRKESMPYFLNGKSLDIALNPLGIPSRMNLGQLYECFLGLAGYFLHESYTVSVFDEIFGSGASRSYTFSKLYESSLKTQNDWLFLPNFPGKTYLFDGVTGKAFEQPISIGFTCILKLIHMVDKKLYARTQGSYSALSKQPVRGRSLNGGQRLGEMEIWALQGYGAAFTLQEVYFLKSGHITNRKTVNHLMLMLKKNKKKDFGFIESFLHFEIDQFSVLTLEFKALLLKM